MLPSVAGGPGWDFIHAGGSGAGSGRGRHVICVVAAGSVQLKVNIDITCGRVVGHVRGAAHYYSPFRVRDGIADHGAPGDYPGSGTGYVVAGYEPTGSNPGPASRNAENIEHGITPHNSPGSNPDDGPEDVGPCKVRHV